MKIIARLLRLAGSCAAWIAPAFAIVAPPHGRSPSWVNVPVTRNVLFSRFISVKFTCLKFESPKQSADGLRIAGSFRKMSRMQFTAHRKRCGIHRITSILYRKTGTYVGGFSAILGLLWRIFRHTSNFLLFLIAVRNIRLF